MAITALVVLIAWLVLVTGLRTYLAYRRTGVRPVLVRAEAWSPQWWARWTSTLGVGFPFAVLMLSAFITAWEIQVRLVEEPYLKRVHGEAYREYAARTGRFLPMIGRLS